MGAEERGAQPRCAPRGRRGEVRGCPAAPRLHPIERNRSRAPELLGRGPPRGWAAAAWPTRGEGGRGLPRLGPSLPRLSYTKGLEAEGEQASAAAALTRGGSTRRSLKASAEPRLRKRGGGFPGAGLGAGGCSPPGLRALRGRWGGDTTLRALSARGLLGTACPPRGWRLRGRGCTGSGSHKAPVSSPSRGSFSPGAPARRHGALPAPAGRAPASHGGHAGTADSRPHGGARRTPVEEPAAASRCQTRGVERLRGQSGGRVHAVPRPARRGTRVAWGRPAGPGGIPLPGAGGRFPSRGSRCRAPPLGPPRAGGPRAARDLRAVPGALRSAGAEGGGRGGQRSLRALPCTRPAASWGDFR